MVRYILKTCYTSDNQINLLNTKQTCYRRTKTPDGVYNVVPSPPLNLLECNSQLRIESRMSVLGVVKLA